MKIKASKKQKIAFARRFSYDDWMLICSDEKLTNAINDGKFALAEVIANELLSEQINDFCHHLV